MASEKNAQAIAANKAKLYELEDTVLHNKFLAYETRACIEENRALILKNYSAAFTGNRQMANSNSDAIFRNRAAILGACKCDGPVQENYRNSMLNEAKITYLEHRSELNSRVAEVNDEMADINAALIAVNTDIMAGNAAVVEFNTKHIQINGQYLRGDIELATATPEKNADRISSNSNRMQAILSRATQNTSILETAADKVSANRAAILKNSDDIFERRKGIADNHKKIRANASKIAGLIGANTAAATLDESSAGAAATTTNAQNITSNKAKLYELEDQVMHNKFIAYEIRSMIEENRAAILKNYAAAFMGNRQMTNSNSDHVFKNRYAVLSGLKCAGPVEENFRSSMMNEAKVAFLDHRSEMNTCVAEVNNTLCDINARLIEVNRKIMAGNEAIVKFNSDQIAINSQLLEGGCDASKATPESNAARIQSNATRMSAVFERARGNAEKLTAALEKVKLNRTLISGNSEAIYERRQKISMNHELMRANATKISGFIANGGVPEQPKCGFFCGM
eukprot:TRINITY_DN1592_c0_g1_i11.p1 TRINITY_DN1592_c0_g1~~TRINITY_DN1592_c0_g1_i11.p1  ORF type:complete len:532 (-),score=129.53 TRINITY_DN1592_c0_g1_i11:180-1715(-)